jgi:hypothetical protein
MDYLAEVEERIKHKIEQISQVSLNRFFTNKSANVIVRTTENQAGEIEGQVLPAGVSTAMNATAAPAPPHAAAVNKTSAIGPPLTAAQD